MTFQNVLDGVRFSVARELLGMSLLSLDDIAATLGYAGVSPFMRAFHRWTEHTAGYWRRAVQRGESIGTAPFLRRATPGTGGGRQSVDARQS